MQRANINATLVQELLFCNASIGTNIMFKPKMMSWEIIETLDWLVAPSTHGRQLHFSHSRWRHLHVFQALFNRWKHCTDNHCPYS